MILLFLITIVFAVLRFVLPSTGTINHADIFKDLAHLWVGVLFGIAGKAAYDDRGAPWRDSTLDAWVLAIGLTIVEIVAFVLSKAI